MTDKSNTTSTEIVAATKPNRRKFLAGSAAATGAAERGEIERAGRYSELWHQTRAAIAETETYNLDRKPLVFTVFGWLAEATRA